MKSLVYKYLKLLSIMDEEISYDNSPLEMKWKGHERKKRLGGEDKKKDFTRCKWNHG